MCWSNGQRKIITANPPSAASRRQHCTLFSHPSCLNDVSGVFFGEYCTNAELCNASGWKGTVYLTRSSSDKDAGKRTELMEKVLGDGVEFSRNQVDTRFACWKTALER